MGNVAHVGCHVSREFNIISERYRDATRIDRGEEFTFIGRNMSNTQALKPIYLYDHLPGILAGFPAFLFLIIALLSLLGPYQQAVPTNSEAKPIIIKQIQKEQAESETSQDDKKQEALEGPFYNVEEKGFEFLNPHMMFWIGLAIMVVWYVAFRFNLPKSKFWMMFGLLGTFVGIPVVLEVTGFIKPFTHIANLLGHLAPEANAGAWFALSLVFFIIWLANFIWSRTHLRIRMDETGLTVNRMGGKGERFELIGLKTENEPLDYLELFMCGVGSLSLKTRMNKSIFTMKRVVGLYRIPWCPFLGNKLARIEEMLSYQGKSVSADRQDAVEASDAEGADEHDHDDFTGEELGGAESEREEMG